MAVNINVSVGDTSRGTYRAGIFKKDVANHPEYWTWESVRASHDISKQGLQNFNKVLQDLGKHMKKNSAAICEQALLPAFEESRRLVPKDTWALHNSGDLTSNNGGFFTKGKASISYGLNGDPFYAAIVHDVYAEHAGDTQWKFLSTAITRKLPAIKLALEKQTKNTMGFRK